MKRFLLRNLLLAAACLFGLSANAQFTGTYEQRVANNYDTAPVEFSLAEVATQVGTDAATLASALDAWTSGTDDLFYLTVPDGLSANYTQGTKGGFWVNADGLPQGWNDETNASLRWYNTLAWDATAGTFTINIGQFPNQCAATDVFNPKFVLKYNDKEATFDVTIKFLEPLVLPEIKSLKESDQNVVVEKTFDAEQLPRTSYDADVYELKLDDVVEKLGLPDASFLQEAMSQMVYTTRYDMDTVDKQDTLTNAFTATPEPGFWYTDIRVGGKEATGECASTGHSEGCYFYLAEIGYTAETDMLKFRIGQFPSKMEGGESFFTYLYFIYGNKAFRLRINLKITEVEQGTGLEGYTKMGEATVDVEQEPTSDYTPKVVVPDLAAIASALGCETSDLRIRALDASNSFANTTANNGGFWFDNDGFVCGWGANAAMFVEPTNAPDAETNLPDLTSFNVGQYPNVLTVGDERTAHLYFFNGADGDKYFAYDVHLIVVKPGEVNDEFTNVRTISFGVQAVPDANAYPIEETWSIDLGVLERILGTTDVQLYGLATDANAEATGSDYSKSYSCDPKPGFWLDADGRVSVWGDSNSRVGICYAANGTFQFFQYPGRNKVGDVFKTQLFLVNGPTGDMITFNISVSFVESIVKAEVVGEEDIVLPVSTEDMAIDIDLSKAATALGVTVDDLLNDQNKYLRGLLDSGMYGEGQNCFDGLGFDTNGYYSLEGNTFFSIEQSGEMGTLSVYSNEAVADDFIAQGKFCFMIDNKQYVYNVTFVSPAIYTGISNVAQPSRQADKMFDLMGRPVSQPQKGLYIMNGKKVVVK